MQGIRWRRSGRPAGRCGPQRFARRGAQRALRVNSITVDNEKAGIRAELRRAALELPDWRVSEQPLTLAGGSCLLDELAGRGVKAVVELPIELVSRKSSAKADLR